MSNPSTPSTEDESSEADGGSTKTSALAQVRATRIEKVARLRALGLDPTFPTTLHFGYLGLWIVAGSLLAVRQLRKRMIV